MYMRSLYQVIKAEDLSVVAQEGFEICNKILGCEVIWRAGLIASRSFVSAVLDLMSIPLQSMTR